MKAHQTKAMQMKQTKDTTFKMNTSPSNGNDWRQLTEKLLKSMNMNRQTRIMLIVMQQNKWLSRINKTERREQSTKMSRIPQLFQHCMRCQKSMMWNKTLICRTCTDNEIENAQNLETEISDQENGNSYSANEIASEMNNRSDTPIANEEVEAEMIEITWTRV